MLSIHRPFVSAVVLAAGLLVTFAAPPAHGDNKTLATELFDDAKRLMDQGKAAEACPKLEESMRLDPTDGTQLRLAYCYELTGRKATAWNMFKAGLAKAKQLNNMKRIDFATEHLAAIEPKLSRVVLAFDPGADIPGIAVKWDGDVIGPAAVGVAFPVDEGPHKLVVNATGKKPFEATITVVGEGTQQTVKIPVLEDVTAPTQKADVHPASDRGWVPWVVGGAGVGFLAATVVSRFMVSGAQSDRSDQCAAQRTLLCDDNNVSKIKTWDRLSYVFSGLAVVGIGASVVLFVSSPSKTTETTIQAGPATIAGNPGFSVQGSF